MSVVIESATGAQVLPAVAHQRATVSEYQVVSCANADLRSKSAAHRALASRLEVAS